MYNWQIIEKDVDSIFVIWIFIHNFLRKTRLIMNINPFTALEKCICSGKILHNCEQPIANTGLYIIKNNLTIMNDQFRWTILVVGNIACYKFDIRLWCLRQTRVQYQLNLSSFILIIQLWDTTWNFDQNWYGYIFTSSNRTLFCI